MNKQKSASVFAALLTVAPLFMASVVWADDTAAAPTKEHREQMAQAHEKMASCLRSDKAIGDCRMEMMQACRSINDRSCGMMMGSGMHHKSTQNSSSSK